MKARIKNQGSNIVFYFDGKIDYETQDTVCHLIEKTLRQNKTDSTPKNIIMNFENLEFVGSTGITQFVQQLKAIHSENQVRPQYAGVRSEFQKIIKAFDDDQQFSFLDQ